jgi:hypothetical protein
MIKDRISSNTAKRNANESESSELQGDIARIRCMHYDAARKYIKAYKTTDPFDSERRLSLLLRIADSYEDFAAQLGREMTPKDILSSRTYLLMANAHIESANYVHKVNNPRFYFREARLIGTAEADMENVKSNVEFVFFRQPPLVSMSYTYMKLKEINCEFNQRLNLLDRGATDYRNSQQLGSERIGQHETGNTDSLI